MENIQELLWKLEQALPPLEEIMQIEGQQNSLQAGYDANLNDKRKGLFGGKSAIPITLISAYAVIWIIMKACEILNVELEKLTDPVIFTFGGVGIVTGMIISIIYKTFMNKRIDAKNENLKLLYADTEERLDEVLEENQNLLAWIPDKYCYYNAVYFFWEVLTNYRAESFKEAINLYEEEMHRNRLEMQQEQILREQRRTSELAMEAVNAAQRAESHARYAASAADAAAYNRNGRY